MFKPSISVIIPTYNSARFLPKALESVLSQTFLPQDVIVVDDGSTDDTEDVLEPFRHRIHYIRQKNQGPAVARNCGIAEAKGELIAFLDADDLWLPQKLEKQVKVLTENPNIGVVHSGYNRLDMAGEPHLVPRFEEGGFFGDCYLLFFRRNGVQIATVLLRKECLTRVGNFDERIRLCEDYDLWFRIARHFEWAYIDSPLALYRVHSTNASKNRVRMLEAELYVVRKALANDPGLQARIGRRDVRHRLFELNHSIGYLYHDELKTSEARFFLLKRYAIIGRIRTPGSCTL